MSKTQLKLSILWFVLVSATAIAKQWSIDQRIWPDNALVIFPLITVASLMIGAFMGRKRS